MGFKYAIALTGSIATGKSTVANCLTKFGFTMIDADRIAHEILNEQSAKIAEMFGAVLVEEGKVDRKALGKIVFQDAIQRERLEALLHPLIYERIEFLSKELDKTKEPYLVDIPLFFESHRYPIKRSIVVYTPRKQQLQRLILRDGYNKEEALRRIAVQMDIEEKRKKATYVIDNSHDMQQLEDECERVKKKILEDFK